jgi:hypothetical protein
MEIARDILRSHEAAIESRACLYHTWFMEKEARRKETYLTSSEAGTRVIP